MTRRIQVRMPVSNLWPGVETAEVGNKVTLFGKPDAATVMRMQVDPTRCYLVVTLDVDPTAGVSTALLDALEEYDPPPVPIEADPAYADSLRGGRPQLTRPDPGLSERSPGFWHRLRHSS